MTTLVQINNRDFVVHKLSVAGFRKSQPLIKRLGAAFGMLREASVEAHGFTNKRHNEYHQELDSEGGQLLKVTQQETSRPPLQEGVVRMLAERQEKGISAVSDMLADEAVLNTAVQLCIYSVPEFFQDLLGTSEDPFNSKGEVSPEFLNKVMVHRDFGVSTLLLMIPSIIEENFGEVGKQWTAKLQSLATPAKPEEGQSPRL